MVGEIMSGRKRVTPVSTDKRSQTESASSARSPRNREKQEFSAQLVKTN